MRSNKEYEKKTKDFEPDVTIDEEEIKETKQEKTITKIIVTVDNLALRDAPNGNKIGIVPMGFNFIVGTTTIDDVEWGELEDGSGFINMTYTRKAD